MEDRYILLIDDQCYMCSSLARFVAGHDPKDIFRITGIHSSPGQKLLTQFPSEKNKAESVLLIHQNKIYRESDAVWKLLMVLDHFKWAGMALRIIPSFIRNPAYRWVANHRYRLVKQNDRCIYHPEMSKKFLT